MINIQKTPMYPEFFELMSSANGEIILCAPYIKKEIITEILENKKASATLTIVTSSNLSNFATGSSDIEAISLLIDNKITVKNYQNLHAKIYFFQNEAIVTSANLTYSGMWLNYEYGLHIKDENSLLKQIGEDFCSMFKSNLCGTFNQFRVKDIKKLIKKMGKTPRFNIDNDGDGVVIIGSAETILSGLDGWQKYLFEILLKINKQDFSLREVYSFKSELELKYPLNHNIEAKIRQTLQLLRDEGLVKFVFDGQYRKLWIIAE